VLGMMLRKTGLEKEEEVVGEFPWGKVLSR
jgi:hypothetical protein